MNNLERLRWQLDDRLVRVIGVETRELEICPEIPGELPNLRCVFPNPAMEKVSMVLRVHSQAGIPLAQATVEVNAGDRSFETPITVLAMEGYGHVGPAEKMAIERRVWSRRAFATGSAA